MREIKLRLVVTFHTTAAAMATEQRCKARGIPGRLAPVPRALTSDCGIAWICEPSQKEELAKITENLEVNQMTELML